MYSLSIAMSADKSIHPSMRRVYQATGTTPTALALAINESTQNVNNWANRGISKNGAIKIASKFKLNLDWILTGNESLPPQGQTQSQHLLPVEPWDSSTPLEDDEIEIPFYKDFKFACGSGKFGEKAIKETRRLRISKLTLRNRGIEFINASAATATDNSMAPTINEGATILIDCGRKKIKDGQIFIFQHGDGEFADYRCKRLYNLPLGGVRIVSDNAEEYPEERLSAQEIQDQHFVVLGWVFSVQQMFTW